MKEILFILLDNYAEHELAFLAQAIKTDESGIRKNPKYVSRYVAPTLEPVTSIAGLRTLPDYSFETMPTDYFALALIGGYDWLTPKAEPVLPIVEEALAAGKLVGAICNATAFMAKHGLLNNIKHTGNGVQALQMFGGGNYTNAATVKFYTEVFGFTTDWDGVQPNVEMKLNDSRIILFPRTDFEQMVSHTFEYTKDLNGAAELSFDVPNFAAVDEAYAHALQHGAVSVLVPTAEPWGQRTCYVADHDGNLIEISSFQA